MVTVDGPDAVSFLDGLVSQDVSSMADGEVRRSFLLGPQGKLRALLWIRRHGEQVAMITDAPYGPQVAGDLDTYRIRVKATIGPALPVVEVWEGEPPGGIRLPGSTILTGGETPAGSEADPRFVDTWRLTRGEPRFGVDVDETTIPHETGLVDEAVSFTKGCYLGQELVARIDSRGHVNRHLRLLRFDGSPRQGPVRHHDREVGAVTTVGVIDGQGYGMGLIRREVLVGDEVEVGDVAVSVLDRRHLHGVTI